MKIKKDRFDIEFDRGMLRRNVLSLFWVAISRRRKQGKLNSLSELAKKIGAHKSQVSRWFSSGDPNWQINTISDIANALEISIEIRAIDNISKEIITPSGYTSQSSTSSASVSNFVFKNSNIDDRPTSAPVKAPGVDVVFIRADVAA